MDYFLFDLDGTISDPRIGITKSVQYSLRGFGIEAELNELIRFIGPPIRDSYKMFFGFNDAEAELAVAKFREYFTEKGLYENELYQGMDTLLKRQKERGKKLILATSKATIYAKKILDYFNIFTYFDFISGCELDGTRSKKSEVIQYVFDNTPDLTLGNSIMIGDKEHDILGAKAVGIKSIGVLYGFGDVVEHEKAGADYIVQSVEELSTFLDTI